VRRTRRTYSVDTKAQLVAACLIPGASIAAIASANDMNANVLHRWLKEQRQSSLNADARTDACSLKAEQPQLPSFIPLPLTQKLAEPKQGVIQVEVRNGAVMMTASWPVWAASEFAQWASAILK